MLELLAPLGIDIPVLAAPMAGGPTTPALVIAAARAGGFGFLAGGYKSPQDLASQIRDVRKSGVSFGVNLFAPHPVPVDPDAYRRYARVLLPEAQRLGVSLPEGEPIEDDDHWRAKIDVLIEDPPPVASFTFGIPERQVIARLRHAGVIVLQTVTDQDEALAAMDAGADGLIVQAATAGGHSATLSPERPPPTAVMPELVATVQNATGAPVIAAGGVATPGDVSAAVHVGAEAVMVGTALLLTEESGVSATHRAALSDPQFTSTVVTRAFTGRPARALRNRFVDRYGQLAPSGYPALHHLTSPLRRAAARAGDPQLLHLWAGTGFRHVREEPVAVAVERLAGEL